MLVIDTLGGFAFIAVVLVLIYKAATMEMSKPINTIDMDTESYNAVKLYRRALRDYHSTLLPSRALWKDLQDRKAKVPTQYHFMLDDMSYVPNQVH